MIQIDQIDREPIKPIAKNTERDIVEPLSGSIKRAWHCTYTQMKTIP